MIIIDKQKFKKFKKKIVIKITNKRKLALPLGKKTKAR